jgi:hypothetical protein
MKLVYVCLENCNQCLGNFMDPSGTRSLQEQYPNWIFCFPLEAVHKISQSGFESSPERPFNKNWRVKQTANFS